MEENRGRGRGRKATPVAKPKSLQGLRAERERDRQLEEAKKRLDDAAERKPSSKLIQRRAADVPYQSNSIFVNIIIKINN